MRDGEGIILPLDSRWTVVQGPAKFAMAVNGSLGWKTAPDDSDVLYIGDDARFTQADTVELLQQAAYSDPEIGLLSPKITGAIGSLVQANPNPTGITYSKGRLAFVCVYIKREVIERVGYLDPIFSGTYGYDDSDYCYRAKLAGYKLAVTPSVIVDHQHAASTFIRAGSNGGGPGDDCRTGEVKFAAKWGEKVRLETEDTVAEDQEISTVSDPSMPTQHRTIPPVPVHVAPTRALRRFSR